MSRFVPQGNDQERMSVQQTKSHHRPQVQKQGLSLLSLPGLVRNLSLIATGSVALIALFLLAGLWHSGTDFFNHLAILFSQPQPEPKVDLRSMVIQQVRNASELTTAVYTMETVVPASRDRTVGGYVIGTTTLLYIAHGEVRAGVDLSALREEDVQVQGDTITLRLPPPKILDSKIDVNRSSVYDYDRGFMGLGPDVAPELQELAQRETLEKIVESACMDGILQQANDRAKLVISQLLATAGHSQLLVEEQSPHSTVCTSVKTSPSLMNDPVLPSMPQEPVPPPSAFEGRY
jgi:hypothetical protein